MRQSMNANTKIGINSNAGKQTKKEIYISITKAKASAKKIQIFTKPTSGVKNGQLS